jgi:hypothetical protein
MTACDQKAAPHAAMPPTPAAAARCSRSNAPGAAARNAAAYGSSKSRSLRRLSCARTMATPSAVLPTPVGTPPLLIASRPYQGSKELRLPGLAADSGSWRASRSCRRWARCTANTVRDSPLPPQADWWCIPHGLTACEPGRRFLWSGEGSMTGPAILSDALGGAVVRRLAGVGRARRRPHAVSTEVSVPLRDKHAEMAWFPAAPCAAG